jgi:hypothetical protein
MSWINYRSSQRIGRLRSRWRQISRRPRGQGLLETALVFPILLIVLSGLVEFGFLLNDYMALQDAVRNATRFASDGLYFTRDADHDCATTRDFYRQTACLVNQELAQERPTIALDLWFGDDDVIISGFSVTQGVGVTARHPSEDGEQGWSEAVDATAVRNQNSRISEAQMEARLHSSAPSTGLVSVEVFYAYYQKLSLPWITAFLDDPVLLHNYAIMPLVSAEPTPTPIP